MEYDYTDILKPINTMYKLRCPKSEIMNELKRHFSLDQSIIILKAMKNNFSLDKIAIIANPEFDKRQMEQVYLGLRQGLPINMVGMYASTKHDYKEMWKIKEDLLSKFYSSNKSES